MKSIVVLSGGMDSATVLGHWCNVVGGDQVEALTFSYGSKHNERENRAAKWLAQHYKVKHTQIHLQFIQDLFKSDLLKSGGDIPEGHYEHESMKRTVVPFRNGIMLSIAAGYAESVGAKEVLLGNHKGDHAIYPDCRESFTKAMGLAILQGTSEHIELRTPFGEISKGQIVEIGLKLAVPYALTYSCYKGGETHCGKCGTCTERLEAFEQNKVPDPAQYNVSAPLK